VAVVECSRIEGQLVEQLQVEMRLAQKVGVGGVDDLQGAGDQVAVAGRNRSSRNCWSLPTPCYE